MDQLPILIDCDTSILNLFITVKARRAEGNVIALPLAGRLVDQPVGLLHPIETAAIGRLVVGLGHTV